MATGHPDEDFFLDEPLAAQRAADRARLRVGFTRHRDRRTAHHGNKTTGGPTRSCRWRRPTSLPSTLPAYCGSRTDHRLSFCDPGLHRPSSLTPVRTGCTLTLEKMDGLSAILPGFLGSVRPTCAAEWAAGYTSCKRTSVSCRVNNPARGIPKLASRASATRKRVATRPPTTLRGRGRPYVDMSLPPSSARICFVVSYVPQGRKVGTLPLKCRCCFGF